MDRTRAKALASAALLVSSQALGAELPRDADVTRPCRPTVSCTADLAAPGSVEAEIGGAYAKLGDGSRQWAYPFLVKQTLTRLLQVQVGSNGYTVTRAAGVLAPSTRHVDNLILGPKLHLLDQSSWAPSIALTAQASLPAFASGNDGAFFTAHASKDVDRWHVDGNVGVDAWWGIGDAAAQPFGALALSVTAVPPFGVALEGYAFGDAQPYAPRDGGVRAAITATPRSWLVFDFGGDVAWFPSTRAFSLFVGMTVLPVAFWREPEGSP